MMFARLPNFSGPGVQKVTPLNPRKQQYRIAMVSTFPPQKCGLATFASDVVEQVTRHNEKVAFDVWAMARSGEAVPGTVAGSIAADDATSYRAAAERINATALDALWLQHEFGIFGGRDGEFILDFVDRVAAPLIVTFHTVLEHP